MPSNDAHHATTASSRSAELAKIGFNAHLAFFDRDDDQKISLRETQQGLARLGLGRLISLPATALIHAGVAGLGVARANFQNPFSLSLPSVGVLRHPDTALVDEQASFEQTRLDEVFTKYGRRYAGTALTLTEIVNMASDRLRENTRSLSELLLLPGGAAGTLIEWGALLWLAGELREQKRVLTKEEVLRFYTDPQFFTAVAKRLEQVRAQRAASLAGQLRNIVQTWIL